ncbi:uncharacterized protein LOC107043610 [Diachasma alloeum]|uniref:uncharacterized protein LOC107043610 n=1 Tax=Diachasma alloeum TaxID=454923 RepID=UPI00073835EC|nr:uncharacterized protein LOC107043610 [Diachasma alloeum]
MERRLRDCRVEEQDRRLRISFYSSINKSSNNNNNCNENYCRLSWRGVHALLRSSSPCCVHLFRTNNVVAITIEAPMLVTNADYGAVDVEDEHGAGVAGDGVDAVVGIL